MPTFEDSARRLVSAPSAEVHRICARDAHATIRPGKLRDLGGSDLVDSKQPLIIVLGETQNSAGVEAIEP
ncbi:hypothetical protein V5279_35920 [Bradyrhizobium sp. 26S5]|uniref:hypothetical protein n=1 Tax=Bradyrhizobium sp. 26S5 TaxID=3139729 RepID=UPI0030CEA608